MEAKIGDVLVAIQLIIIDKEISFITNYYVIKQKDQYGRVMLVNENNGEESTSLGSFDDNGVQILFNLNLAMILNPTHELIEKTKIKILANSLKSRNTANRNKHISLNYYNTLSDWRSTCATISYDSTASGYYISN